MPLTKPYRYYRLRNQNWKCNILTSSHPSNLHGYSTISQLSSQSLLGRCTVAEIRSVKGIKKLELGGDVNISASYVVKFAGFPAVIPICDEAIAYQGHSLHNGPMSAFNMSSSIYDTH